jgi:Fe-S cluster biogenesis protein NfuA
MFIQTETTPNPATIKFLPGCPVMAHGTAVFVSPDTASPSPLAQRLFAINDVKRVFFGSDFISVTKSDNAEWDLLKTHVLAEIMQHFASGLPVMNEQSPAPAASAEDNEIIVQIKEILDTRVRPAVAADGGDVAFDRFEDGVVYLRMQGACAGCPSASATLKMGIENLLKHYVPEVVRVEPAENNYEF